MPYYSDTDGININIVGTLKSAPDLYWNENKLDSVWYLLAKTLIDAFIKSFPPVSFNLV